jgi:hypothetical protein
MLLLQGTVFNEIYKNIVFYKILEKDGIHHGFKYKHGINKDIVPLPIGGLHFIEKSYIPLYIFYGVYLCKVTVPNDAMVCVSEKILEPSGRKISVFKSDKLIVDVNNKIFIEELDDWNDYQFCYDAVQLNGYALRHVKNQTDELCELAVQDTGYAILSVKNKTPKICEIAIQTCSNSAQFVT